MEENLYEIEWRILDRLRGARAAGRTSALGRAPVRVTPAPHGRGVAQWLAALAMRLRGDRL